MAQNDYDRYSILKNNDGTVDLSPFVNLPVNSSDKYETWNTTYSRLDKLSSKYYGNPFFDFLILYANPQYVSEFDIKEDDLIRIPFPLQKAKTDYENALIAFKTQ